MHQVPCPKNPFLKPSTGIHMYDAKDILELLSALIRRSSHSTILSKFGSKKSFNLNLRRVPWWSCSWLRGLDSVKLAPRCSMTLMWTASSNNYTGNYDVGLLWDSEGKEEVYFLQYHSAWVLRVTVRDSWFCHLCFRRWWSRCPAWSSREPRLKLSFVFHVSYFCKSNVL